MHLSPNCRSHTTKTAETEDERLKYDRSGSSKARYLSDTVPFKRKDMHCSSSSSSSSSSNTRCKHTQGEKEEVRAGQLMQEKRARVGARERDRRTAWVSLGSPRCIHVHFNIQLVVVVVFPAAAVLL
jgi:hypothetical protein